MIEKILFYFIAFISGWFFTKLGISAGWIIGSLLAGIFYSLFVNKIIFSKRYFSFILGFIGVNIGLMIDRSLFTMLLTYKTPLAISILLIVLGSFVLCWILYKYTFVDKLTALFSCMPGGASVMISLSEDYGADSRIVTAFHTVRMTVFVICIPLLAGLITNAQGTMQVDENSQAISTMLTLKLLILASIVIGSIYVAKVIKIPSAPFTLSMIFGFIFNQFIFPLGEMPAFTVSIPLVLLGGLIGLRFSRDLLKRLSAIKKYVLLIIFLYTLLGSGVAFLVYEVTSLNFTTSLLSIIPGGAAEMASTAALLGQDASFVASFQLIRLLILSLFFPIIAHFMFRKNLEGTNLDSAKRS